MAVPLLNDRCRTSGSFGDETDRPVSMTQIPFDRPFVSDARLFAAWLRDDRGQDLIEYALLAATIGLVGVAAFQLMGNNMNTVYTGWDAAVQSVWETPDPIAP
jgi:Flp pilus assembly pilin Flp